MSHFEIVGQNELYGEVNIQGSKNATLPILAATVLNKGITRLINCPRISDVENMLCILRELGCKTEWIAEQTVVIDATEIVSTRVPSQYVGVMRCSVLFLGALLGRCHEVTISYPGGCSIGLRKIDYHLDAFKKMMVTVSGDEKDNMISCTTACLIGTDIFLKFPSVGATQNIILSAVLAKGTTRIFNAAKEPEIVALCEFLVSCGASIRGIGESVIKIEGVDRLHNTTFSLPMDRIVTGTYMTAIMMAGGDVILHRAPILQLRNVAEVLSKIGCEIETTDTYTRVRCYQRKKAFPTIRTAPYPGFPTDMQSQLLAVLSVADGNSRIEETIFESRYKTAYELMKMGANITILPEERAAIVHGVKKLTACDVQATDLRGGAALIVAALGAEGVTRVYNTEYVERGYEDIVKDLSALGATIRKCEEKF